MSTAEPKRLEEAMWSRPLALALLYTLMACGSSRSQRIAETPGVATDTVVTTRTVVDTTIVTIDTTIALDTTVTVDTVFRVDTTRIEAGRGEVVDTAE
jgi:hypothetical protein